MERSVSMGRGSATPKNIMKQPTKLPEKFLKPPKQLVRDMPVGAEGYVGGGQLRVGPDLSVYLRARATLEKDTFLSMKVKREEDGFVVWLSKHQHELYSPDPLDPDVEPLPVIRIEEWTPDL
jgi:hypothetical protein